ncbi:MAG: PilZ domain-containing protein [Labilithrix sp.]|nr:PilZ domain-containing protein [Labilithrix sp.]MCW5810353.1 PilZ domain-containing protein [Labilithrix sp.]
MSESKRADERITINKEFESFDAFIQEYVTNISRSGVFIRAQRPLPVGTQVNLHFTVIMDAVETIEGVGEVVRVEKDGMGVVFRELSAYSKDLLDKLLIQRR